MLYAVHPAGRAPTGTAVTEPEMAMGHADPSAGHDGERAAGVESLAPAVTRAALILDVLAESRRRDRSGRASSPAGSACPKSSIANICGALADAGLVRRIGTGFALGRRLAELGGAYLASRRPGPGVLRGVAASLPTGSEETVQFAVLDGLEVTYLARHDGRQPVRLTSRIGRRLPATFDGDRQGRPRLARPTPSSSAVWPG